MLRRSVRIQSQIKPKRKVLVIKSIRGLANLYLDKSWKRGCETINLTGKDKENFATVSISVKKTEGKSAVNIVKSSLMLPKSSQ